MIKKLLLSLVLIIGIIASIVAYRTLTAKSVQLNDIKAAPVAALPDSAVSNLQKAIRCQTISFGDTSLWKAEPFIALRQLIETAYPLVNSKMSREVFSEYSYFYKWEGKNPALAPYIFMAHQDVVPVEEASRNLWKAEPFSGALINNVVYGRGAIDNKCNLISMLEAAEKLLKEGFQPDRTIYFIFGHDEEIGGRKGALKIAKALEARGIKADLLIDEGGIITKEKVPGTKKAVALVATAEKGYLSLDFTVSKKGGHSSMPDKETAIDILMKGLTKLHDNPFPTRFDDATKGFIRFLGPELDFPNNMAFTNEWLFKPLIISAFEKSAPSRAMIRTTSVTTILNAGIKDNVVPSIAKATANFRLLPGDSAMTVIRKVKELINDDRIEISIKNGLFTEGTKATSSEGIGFQKINKIVKQTYDNVLVSPFLLIGATDSRHFSKVSDHIIKFSPVIDPVGFHTYDEQVSVEAYQHSIWFFEQLLRDAK